MSQQVMFHKAVKGEECDNCNAVHDEGETMYHHVDDGGEESWLCEACEYNSYQ